MPKNCSVPLCPVTERNNAAVSFHEIPSKPELRATWLKKISRQGTSKGTEWVPSSRAVICSLHFTEQDFKQGAKRRMLLSEAVPSVFLEYPCYLQPAPASKRRRLQRDFCETPSTSTSVHPESPTETEDTFADVGDDNTTETSQRVGEYGRSEQADIGKPRLEAKECQTVFNLKALMDHVKKLEKRLQMQAKLLGDKLAFLRTANNNVRARLKEFEDNMLVQCVLNVEQAAQ
ncbi:unnamed protein product, partial [Ixodes pacificus]